MSRPNERKLSAYFDGALSERDRRAVERYLEREPDGRRQLDRHAEMSALVRDAWTEGPPTPRTDMLIQSLRPMLARIDAELAERRSPMRWLRRISELLGPIPLATAVAAAALVLAFVALDRPDSTPPVPVVAAGISFGSPSSVYDLEQAEKPLMIFQTDDGVTVIWLLDDDPGLDLTPLLLDGLG